MTTIIRSQLAVDPALTMNANYRFNSSDRRYIDDQIRAVEQLLVENLINGRHASWYTLSGASAAVIAGDTVCTASVSGLVTKSTAGALSTSNSAVGVVIQAASPGGKVLVAIGGIVPPSITGLGLTSGFARINTTTSRCERVAAIGSGDYVLGTVDAAGYLHVMTTPFIGVGDGLTSETIEWNPTSSAGVEAVTSKAIYATTTDATTLTLATFTQPAESTVDYTATVTGRSSNGKHFRLDLRAAYEVIDGVFTAIDAPSTSNPLSMGNAAGWTAVFDRSGSDVRIRVTGAAATTIRWSVVADAQISYIDSVPGFDPLSVGTPLLWVDASVGITHTGDGTDCTVIADQAGGTMTITVPGTKEPTFDAVDVNYNNGPTLDCGSDQGFQLTTHGLTTTPFTLVIVGDGSDNIWLQDGNGNYLISAGGGSGNKLQMAADAATYLVTTTVCKNVPGVYIFVFNGATSKIYTSALTVDASGPAGALADLTGVTLGIGGTWNLTGPGLGGSLRHVMIFDGALSDGDCGYLLAGFGAESNITIGA